MGIRKNGNRTGELQSYAPKVRRKINCNVAVIGESASQMYFIKLRVIFCVDGWSLMWGGGILGDCRCGFRGERLDADNLFMLRYFLETFYELIMDLHILFNDFKQACDSINRTYLYEILK